MAEQESGFEIRGRFYPWPNAFRLGDAVLIEKVTGLDWPSFTERLPEEDESPDTAEPDDLVVVIGLMAASIWQNHEQWRRDKVVRYVEGLDLETITFIGGDAEDEPEEGDASPPDLTVVGETTSDPSPPASTPQLEEESSDEPSPSSSGAQDSTTTSPDSPQAE